jgi:hypothetical protein
MTKVELQFDLARPADAAVMQAIERAHAVYGMHGVMLSPSLDALTVTYDASRLTPADVEMVLLRSGIAATRRG